MRKNIYTFLAVAFAAGLLAGCGSKDSGKDTTIVVGASPAPHAEILEAAKPVLEKAGYTLEIKEYNDYVQPNVALHRCGRRLAGRQLLPAPAVSG